MTQIALKDLRKSFGGHEVIKGVDLEIRSGEFMVFVGPSGCGKSTLLRMIAGLESISAGDLAFDGEVMNTVLPSKRGISMVFQSYALYPHMTVFENMAFGLRLLKEARDRVDLRVRKAAALLQIEGLLHRLPKELSGGQRQRVAIGRAIVRDPRVFLFDEPLSNLDAALRVATRIEIAKLHHDMQKVTMIYVTHDQVEAMTLADRIAVLRDGRLEQVGTPKELYERPNSLFVASFIGSPKMNLLNGAFAATHGCATIGIRPEHLEVATGRVGAWTGPLVHAEDLGADRYLYVDIGATDLLVVREQGAQTCRIGDRITVAPQPEHLHRFNEEGWPMAA
jgi:multiple sugar transport system ATP-binding protein